MSDFKVIDTISVYQIEPGDLFRVEGNLYRAISIEDLGDSVLVTVESLDDAVDDDEIIMDAFSEIDILAYDYDGVEV